MKLERKDWLVLAALVAAAALIRTIFVMRMGLPTFDPWRHMLLVQNLRAGEGFTLFAGQPYLWYNPGWHHLLAAMPDGLSLAFLPALLSSLSVVPVYLILRRLAPDSGILPAVMAAALMAGAGPMVKFTCHFGSESCALFLALSAVAVAAIRPHAAAWLVAGLLFGLALTARMNLLFSGLLFLLFLKRGKQSVMLGLGTVVPLAAVWWRNHGIISDHGFLFTWDGLATRCADFTAFSTLFIQGHPSVQEGLRRLHEQIAPDPQWIRDATGVHFDSILFMLTGALATLFSKNKTLILAAALPIGYFFLLDKTLSSHFFRIYLGVFPVFFLALALVAGNVARRKFAGSRWVALGLAAIPLVTGARFMKPEKMYPLEYVTPPPQLLTESHYLVNSSFYHPESLIYRYPSKDFLGMPLDAKQLPDFRAEYPDHQVMIWHGFSVQESLRASLKGEGYKVKAQAPNLYGRVYTVLEPGE